MPHNTPTLVLVYEPEKSCFDRLIADGYPKERAVEISSYLAQSTDLAPEFELLAALFYKSCKDALTIDVFKRDA